MHQPIVRDSSRRVQWTHRSCSSIFSIGPRIRLSRKVQRYLHRISDCRSNRKINENTLGSEKRIIHSTKSKYPQLLAEQAWVPGRVLGDFEGNSNSDVVVGYLKVIVIARIKVEFDVCLLTGSLIRI